MAYPIGFDLRGRHIVIIRFVIRMKEFEPQQLRQIKGPTLRK